MEVLQPQDIIEYVEQNIGSFHQKRIIGLSSLKLTTVLARKNPYLFKAKSLVTAPDIVKSITDAFLSSQEETLFGDWLEGLAIFVNQKVYNGRKSGIPGIDLEFDHQNVRYLVTIKSGPNWANSSQIKKLELDFKTAKKTLQTSGAQTNVVAVNGCCYGRDNKPNKGGYYKYCGQRFWEFISGDPELYTKIIEPLGYQARERNEEFLEAYVQMINKFTKEFLDIFCTDEGNINWEKLIRFNSAIGLIEL